MGIATSIKKKLRGSGTNLSDTSTGVTGSMAATATAVKDVPASQGWGWLTKGLKRVRMRKHYQHLGGDGFDEPAGVKQCLAGMKKMQHHVVR